MNCWSGSLLCRSEFRVKKSRSEELRQEARELTGMVHRLAMEVNRLADRQTSEREKMQLWVENQMLRFERRLPPARSSEDNSSTEKE